MAEHGLRPNDYVHLHNHTQYSLLDGLTKLPALFQFAKDTGMEAVAMTDHGTLSGAIDFYKKGLDAGVKPIIGIETYVAARRHTDKDPQKDKQRFHLILLAMNHKGYQNLMQLSTTANLHGFYYYPRVDHELLEKYNEGIIALSACMGGEVGDRLRGGDYEKAREVAEWYKSVFGDRYYLEIQDHGHPKNELYSEEQGKINQQVLKLGKELDIPVALTCDAHYLKHEDQDAHEILLCVGTGSFLSDEKRMSLKDYPLHVVEPVELIERWGSEHPEVIRNTKAIADRCNLELELGGILIPKFPVPEGETEKSYLDRLVFQGLAWRYAGTSEEQAKMMAVEDVRPLLKPDVLQRAEYELGVIEQMGFNGYFLIIADFMGWGKDQGIVFGPGRGSAAGSIISYALKITELDPLKYDLLFERFLNPDRISMPDIDIDIQDTRRDEVIEYCAKKYGQERVSNIVTFGTMAARNAVRDVARVLQVPYAEADRWSKMVPAPVQGRHIPLEISIAKDPDLKKEYETNEKAKEVFDLAVRVEGTIRSHGIHACGVVIAPDDIVKFAPLEIAQKGVVSTQYPKDPVEELGLLKMDFLGLSNLTVMNNALRIIRKVYGVEIDINNLPLDDELTFELLRRGDTTGVFQFESSGMKRYLRELKATEFDDVIAMGALYRPGPLSAGLTDSFIKRKNGLEEIAYAHPLMKGALEPTFGVLVYQEQVMRISRDVCGFTGGEADTLRKAIGKKKKDVMEKMSIKFMDGAVANGVPRAVIEKFWKDLLGFADYCFNKSHSACYGMISYQTAYLKAHYPSAFMAALMTSDFDDTDRLAIEIGECQKMGIKVMSPDVNESFVEFAVVPDKVNPDNRRAPIRFGMAAIKNVGTGAVEEILRARKECKGGKFEDLSQFLACVNPRIANRKALESLVKAGAFDRFVTKETNGRSMLLHNLDAMLAYANRIQKEASSGQVDLFGNAIDTADLKPQLTLDTPVINHNQREQLLWERELLGLYLSQHPLDMFKDFLQEQTLPLKELVAGHDGKQVAVGGVVTDMREILTKKGDKMAFVKIEDMSGEAEAILFPSTYQQTIGVWERDKIVLIRGKVNARDREGKPTDDIKIMVDDAREITAEQAEAYKARGRKPKVPKIVKKRSHALSGIKGPGAKAVDEVTAAPERVYIRLADAADSAVLMALKQAIDENKGPTDVVLVLGPDASKQAIKLPTGMNNAEPALTKLQQLVGAENVKVR
ncbi:MAG TPA: DNA polymerase III subunit alpha [Candidatus Saccharimonadales bacterium]|nr:DNA polymerase III subunit alpha [Candidatus Saccharimonadales bacterium]